MRHPSTGPWRHGQTAARPLFVAKILCTQLEIYKTPPSSYKRHIFFLLKTHNKTPSKTRLGNNKLVTAQARQDRTTQRVHELTDFGHRLVRTECRNAPPVQQPVTPTVTELRFFSIFTFTAAALSSGHSEMHAPVIYLLLFCTIYILQQKSIEKVITV